MINNNNKKVNYSVNYLLKNHLNRKNNGILIILVQNNKIHHLSNKTNNKVTMILMIYSEIIKNIFEFLFRLFIFN